MQNILLVDLFYKKHIDRNYKIIFPYGQLNVIKKTLLSLCKGDNTTKNTFLENINSLYGTLDIVTRKIM